MMIKNVISLSILATMLVSGTAMATENVAGGTISLTGAITDTTCTINGGKNSDFTIALNPISITDAGTSVGVIQKNQKAISLSFSDCTQGQGSGNLKMYFSSADNISIDGKYLVNDTVNEADDSIARNVGFALTTSSNKTTPIALDKPFDTGVVGNTSTPENLTLIASYYKVNAKPAQVGL